MKTKLKKIWIRVRAWKWKHVWTFLKIVGAIALMLVFVSMAVGLLASLGKGATDLWDHFVDHKPWVQGLEVGNITVFMFAVVGATLFTSIRLRTQPRSNLVPLRQAKTSSEMTFRKHLARRVVFIHSRSTLEDMFLTQKHISGLYNKPIPSMAELLKAKKNYRAWPIDTTHPLYSEPFVDVRPHNITGRNQFFYTNIPPHYEKVPNSIPELFLRTSILDKLQSANRRLQQLDLELFVHDAWRPASIQNYFHDHWLPKHLRAKHPEWSEEQVKDEVGKYWAVGPKDQESIDLSSPPPHLTGAAVDLTLRRLNGDPLWMGTIVDDTSERAYPDSLEGSTDLSFSDQEALRNRRLLYWVMCEEGFVVNPTEWWHFSWGDQMWAKITSAVENKERPAWYSAVNPISKTSVVNETFSSKPQLDVFTSYLAMIENSVGSNIYRSLYFRIDGKPIDVLENGDLSCSMFVSMILHTFGLMKELHTTVRATLQDLKESGWYEISQPRKGALVYWGFKKKDDGTQGKHPHIGFYIDAETAISNDSTTRVVAKHHVTFGTFPNGEVRRDIQTFYWHQKLDTQ